MKRYVLLMACAAMIAACQTPTEEDNQEDPTPVPEEEVTETQIPEEGGTVTEGDISVDIPQGTFTGGGAIAVVPTTQGSTLGAGEEMSDYYQITLSQATNEEIAVSVKADEGAPGTGVLVQAKGWARHKDGLQPANTLLESQYQNGAYKANIPAIESDSEEPITLTIGVARDYAAGSAPAQTKAEDKKEFTTENGVTYKLSWIGNGGAYEEKILNKVRPYVNEALVKVEDLGFRIPSGTVIPIQLSETDDWGNFVQHNHINSWSHVELSAAKFSRIDSYDDLDLMELRKTLIHELMHYYCAIGYERRKAESVVIEGVNGSIWTVMDEAAGSWSEKMSGDGEIGLNSVVSTYVQDFCASFFPPELDLYVSQSHGYAMGLFMQYISKRVKSDLVVEKMYKKRYDLFNWGFYVNRPSLKDVFEHTLKEEYKIDFFNTDAYAEFADSLLQGAIDSRIHAGQLCPKAKSLKMGNNKFTQDIYDWGFRVYRLGLDASVTDVENKMVYVSEECDAVETYLIIEQKGVWQRTPIRKMEGKFAASDLVRSGGKAVYVMSMNKVQGKLAEGKSNPGKLTLRIEDPEPKLEILTDGLHFDVGGGTQYIDFNTNCNNITVSKENLPWIIRAQQVGDQIEVVANFNQNEDPNEGKLVIRASNSKGSVEKEVTLLQDGQITIRQRQYWGVYVRLWHVPRVSSKGRNIDDDDLMLPYSKNNKMVPVYCVAEVADSVMTVFSEGSYPRESSNTVMGYTTQTHLETEYEIQLTVDLRKAEEKLVGGHVSWRDWDYTEMYDQEGKLVSTNASAHSISFRLENMPFKYMGYRMDWLSDEYGHNECDRMLGTKNVKDKDGITYSTGHYIKDYVELFENRSYWDGSTSIMLRDEKEGDWEISIGLYGKDQGNFIPWGTPEDEIPEEENQE